MGVLENQAKGSEWVRPAAFWRDGPSAPDDQHWVGTTGAGGTPGKQHTLSFLVRIFQTSMIQTTPQVVGQIIRRHAYQAPCKHLVGTQ